MQDWINVVENSQSVTSVNDVAEAAFGPKPSEQQISDFSRYRGMTYQRNGKKNQDRDRVPANVPKVPPPPPNSIAPNSELNIDLGGWINNAEILVHVAEIMKIPSQKGKLLKAIEEPSQSNMDKAVAYQDAPVILQSMDKGN